MRAAVLEQIEAPLVIHDLDLPPLEPGQVLVKVLMAGICGSQLQEIDGIKGDPAHLPHLLGHEGCGIVEATGPEVTHVWNGAKVAMHWRKGVGMDVAGGVYGNIKSGPITTFSNYSIVSENRLTTIDHDVPTDFATLLGCALSTAIAVVENEARPKNKDVVCVRGCGGLGLAIIFALKALKIVRAIGIDVCKDKKRLVESLGGRFSLIMIPSCDILIDTISNEKPDDHKGKYISLQPGGTSAGGFLPSIDIPRYVIMWRRGLLDGYKKLITQTVELDGINMGLWLMRRGKAGRVMIDMNHP